MRMANKREIKEKIEGKEKKEMIKQYVKILGKFVGFIVTLPAYIIPAFFLLRDDLFLGLIISLVYLTVVSVVLLYFLRKRLLG